MTTQERIEIMQAFSEGNAVEYFDGENWNTDSNPSWNWFKFTWRIKSPLTYIPFTFEDRKLLRGKWIKFKKEINCEILINFINVWKVGVDGNYYNYPELLDNFTFLDGTPCGKLQQNN